MIQKTKTFPQSAPGRQRAAVPSKKDPSASIGGYAMG